MDQVDAVVIGAGVVGLSVAAELARAGFETVVLEKNTAIGEETSSRNSEVIHAGIYYPEGSLKAKHCVEGRRLLYNYCDTRGVAFRKTGKLIVASASDEPYTLENLMTQGKNNGVEGLKLLDHKQLASLEPELDCRAALLSQETGIVDSHGLMLSLQGEMGDHGAMIAFGCPVEGIEADGGTATITTGGPSGTKLRANLVVNAAGLSASELASRTRTPVRLNSPQTRYCKGTYFSLVGSKNPFRHLVYPVPDSAGLGIHATLDLAGQVRFGPDVEWIDRLDYSPDPTRCHDAELAVRRYWPGLPDGALSANYAGIRPKLVAEGQSPGDFVIAEYSEFGLTSLINLFGIESPGLTASLSIAKQVRTLAETFR